MLWFMVYVTVAVVVLSILGASCTRDARRDPTRLLTILATAVFWPVVALGLLQFEAIRLAARHIVKHAPAPVSGIPS